MRHVPVIGRADQHGVDVFAIKNVLKMFGDENLVAGRLLRRRDRVIADVGNRSDADIGNGEERFQQRPATAASADQSNVQSLIRGKRLDTGAGDRGPVARRNVRRFCMGESPGGG